MGAAAYHSESAPGDRLLNGDRRALFVAAALLIAGCAGRPQRELVTAATSEVTPGATRQAATLPVAAGGTPAPATAPGYPEPAPATPRPDPNVWSAEAAIETAVPAGAVVSQRSMAFWRDDPEDPNGLYGVRYTLDRQPNVAAINVLGRPPAVAWDLRRDGPADLDFVDAWPMTISGSGPAIALRTDYSSSLLLLSFRDEPHVTARLPVPDRIDPKSFQTYAGWPHFAARDLTGDGLPDPVLYFPATADAEPLLALYQVLPDGTSRLAHTAAPGTVLHDHDGDGLLDVISPGASGSWDLWRWQGDGFAVTETLAAPAAPAPQSLAANALPPLPANLTFLRRGEGAVHRWTRAGGTLQTLWTAQDAATGLRGFRVSADGSHVLYALERHGEHSPNPVTLTLQDVNTGDFVELPTFGELRDYEISADGQRVVYMGIGAGPDGAIVPRPPSNAPHPRPGLSGTVFAVDSVDPTRFTAVGDCPADPNEWWVTNCSGEVALSPDGSQVAFADGLSLWVAPLANGEPRKVVDHYKTIENETAVRIYRPDRWVPGGRRLLLDVGGYEGAQTAIVDTTSGEVTNIPDTFIYSSPLTQMAFFPDTDAMFVTRWRGDAPLRIVDLAAPEEPTALWDTPAVDPEFQYHAIGAAVGSDGGLRFGLRHWNAAVWRGNGVFRAARDGTGLVLLAALPPPDDDPEEHWYYSDAGELSWSADGSVFLMRYTASGERTALVGLADGSGLWDVTELLGEAEWAEWSQ